MIESVFWYSTVRAFELVSAGNEDKTPKGKSVTKEFWNSEISVVNTVYGRAPVEGRARGYVYVL